MLHPSRFPTAVLFAVVLSIAMPALAAAAVLGTNPPSQPVTTERIATLPASQQPAWRQYLDRSQRQMQTDKATLSAELKKAGGKAPAPAPAHAGARTMPLDRPSAWYATAEATHIADVVLSFQTPAGGWSKNIDMSITPRAPGQAYNSGPDGTAALVTPGDFGLQSDVHWDYVGTIDNDATITQIRYLAKVATAPGAGSAKAAPYRSATLRGIDYLFNAQYPNGGWPQIWPLTGGYHDGVTFNDDAMIQVMELLDDVATGKDEFAFVPAPIRKRASASVAHGIECILASQIKVDGHLTAWCQQYDPVALTPASARNYEMPSQSAAESGNILLFLMSRPHLSPAETSSIRAAGDWLIRVAIHDSAFKPTPEGRDLVASSGAPLLWARYYQVGTDKPLFGDRDKSIHDKVSEISKERRNGYAWYSTSAQRAVTAYTQWRASH